MTHYVCVSALMESGKMIIPEFHLSKNTRYLTNSENQPFSAVEYLAEMSLPTLAELRHAFFGGSEDYRQKVLLSKKGCGEWTSTFLQDGKRAVERPENVVYRNGVWVVEGGKVTPVELPPAGWVMEYDKMTGFPSRTSRKIKDAEKVFGNDISYFYHINSGVGAVLRKNMNGHTSILDTGPFFVGAGVEPDYRSSNIGGRECRRIQPTNE